MCFCLLFTDCELDDLSLVREATAILAASQDAQTAPATSDPDFQPMAEPQGTEATNINIDHVVAATSAYVQETKSKSTVRKQKIVVNRFTDWLISQNETRSLSDMDIDRIDQLLAFWLMDLKSANGTEYELGTITSYLSSIKAYLKDIGHDINKLDVTKRVSMAKKKNLKSQGKGNLPNRASCLSPEDEDKLWDSGAFGKSDPESLLHSLWYIFTKGFGFRGRHEARQLQVQDVEKKSDGEGRAYLEWNERLTKTRDGSSSHRRAFAPRLYETPETPDRCPVMLYDTYMSKRDDKITEEAFWLTINPNFKPGNKTQWYSNCPMGENRIAKIMSRSAKRAGIDSSKKITNHSVRRTMCSQLYQANIPPVIIAQISGHKNVSSLVHYTEASEEQQRNMSHLLVNSGRQSNIPNSGRQSNIAIENPPRVGHVAASADHQTSLMFSENGEAGVTNFSRENNNNVLNQARGLMGFMSNATFHGTVNINLNISQ